MSIPISIPTSFFGFSRVKKIYRRVKKVVKKTPKTHPKDVFGVVHKVRNATRGADLLRNGTSHFNIKIKVFSSLIACYLKSHK
jgi:hypothetical protein